MKMHNSSKIKTLLHKHYQWLNGDSKGVRMELDGEYLKNEDLCEAVLTDAILTNVILRGVNLRDAILNGVDLRGSDLSYVDLSGSKLKGTDLRCANLRGAILSGAVIDGADLRGAILDGATLKDAIISNTDINFPIACPEKGSFIGFKKAGDYIVELEIPEDSLRVSATSRACRCSKAKVLSITNCDGTDSGINEINSNHDPNFTYKIGEIVTVDNFDTNRWNWFTTGIHFFITRDEAVRYLMGVRKEDKND